MRWRVAPCCPSATTHSWSAPSWTSIMDKDQPTPIATTSASVATETDVGGHHIDHGVVVVPDAGSWLCCVPCHWLRTNTSVHKASLTVATLLVMSLLVASPVLFLISSVPGRGHRTKECFRRQDDDCTTDEPRYDATCGEEACRQAAARSLASMARGADPCKDFYAFACGGWANHAKDTARGRQSESPQSFNTLQDHVDQQIQELLAASFSSKQFQKLGHFYNSCLQMREKRTDTEPIFGLLSELGGYLSPGTADPPDLTPLLGELLMVNGALFFDVYVDRDLHNSSRLAVFVDLPLRFGHTTRLLRRPASEVMLGLSKWFDTSTSSPPRGSQRWKRSHNKESRAYTYIKDSAEEKRLMSLEKLLHEFFPENLPSDQRMKEAHSILLFASMLNKLYPREKDIIARAQQKEGFQMYSMSQLQEKYEFVQWKNLMEKVFASNFTGSEVFYVVAPGYMTSLKKMLSHFQNRVVHNALLLVYGRDILLELVNVTSSSSWPGFCTRVTVNLFSKAVSALYVQQFVPEYLEDLRKQVTALFERLKSTLTKRIRSVSWLDNSTRVAALEKMSSLRGHFFTWPSLWNHTYVASILQEVKIDQDDFFGNVIRRYRQLRTMPKNFRNVTKVERKWANPFVVNAFYELTSNSIVVPLAVLTQPYFRPDVPRYVRYATVGLVLAHEILHAFDLSGIEYDAHGVPADWFSPEARLRLEARMDCVAKQYGGAFSKQVNFLGSTVNVQFDWNLTRNENMADLSALQVAYDTWNVINQDAIQDTRLPGINMDQRQLFFLNAAQTYCSNLSPEDYILLVEMDFHTPYPERVNGVMMNSPAFAEAFSCPTSSAMNPSKKCSIW